MRPDELTPERREQRQLVIDAMLGAGFWRHTPVEGIAPDASDESFEYEPTDDDDVGMMVTWEGTEGYLDYVVSHRDEHARAAIYFGDTSRFRRLLDEIVSFKARPDSVEAHMRRMYALCPRTELWSPDTDDYVPVSEYEGDGIAAGQFADNAAAGEDDYESHITHEPGPRGDFVRQICDSYHWDATEHEKLRNSGIAVEPDAYADFIGDGVAASLGYYLDMGLIELQFGRYGEEGLTFHFYVDDPTPLVRTVIGLEEEIPVDPDQLPVFMAALVPHASRTVFLGPDGPIEFTVKAK